MDIKKEVGSFAFIAFTLLGVLFGMQIMAFIFGNLGPTEAGLTAGSTAFNTSQAIQNNSLAAVETYSGQSDTQLSTVAISITLAVLIALFVLFMRFFMDRKKGGGSNFG